MGVSFGSSEKKGKSSQKTNPWAPAIPGLTSLIGQINDQAETGVGATDEQLDAFSQLKSNAAKGNPYAGDLHALTADLFGAPSRSGTVDDAYGAIQGQLGDVASGKMLDVDNNPYLSEMLGNVSDSIYDRINASFAGSGRDITGNAAGLKAVGKGISEGTLPTLFNQYNLERNAQSDAAKTLFGAGTSAATTAQGLDDAALTNRLRGAGASELAMNADNYGPNTILNLEEQLKDMPAEDLANYVTLLGSIAGLGGQSTGTQKQSGTSFGLGINDVFGGIGAVAGAVGGLLSDERAKEGVDGEDEPEKVGELADGTPIYRYRYKRDPKKTTHIGVMAQDVEKRDPDAVSEVGGFKVVDYERATDRAAKKVKR